MDGAAYLVAEVRTPNVWIVKALIPALATGMLLARGNNVPRDWWKKGGTATWLTMGAVIVLVGQPFLRAWAKRRADREEILRRHVTDALVAAHVNLVEDADLDWKEIGVNAWLVVGGPWARHLKRIGRHRVTRIRPPSQVRWTKGKGIIGECWERGGIVVKDLRSLWGSYIGASRHDWETAPTEVRQGLSFEEYQRVNKYGAVLAMPVVDSAEKLIGVVSVDAPSNRVRDLHRFSVQRHLQDAATTIANLVETRKGR